MNENKRQEKSEKNMSRNKKERENWRKTEGNKYKRKGTEWKRKRKRKKWEEKEGAVLKKNKETENRRKEKTGQNLRGERKGKKSLISSDFGVWPSLRSHNKHSVIGCSPLQNLCLLRLKFHPHVSVFFFPITISEMKSRHLKSTDRPRRHLFPSTFITCIVLPQASEGWKGCLLRKSNTRPVIHTTPTCSALTHRFGSALGFLNDSELPLMVSLNQNFHLHALPHHDVDQRSWRPKGEASKPSINNLDHPYPAPGVLLTPDTIMSHQIMSKFLPNFYSISIDWCAVWILTSSSNFVSTPKHARTFRTFARMHIWWKCQ